MKTTKLDILTVALNLFAKQGFDAVSTSMIAGELGITKGALYRHFTNKQEILDSIIQRMFELDEEGANEKHVPAKEYGQDAITYQTTELPDLCEYVNQQFVFWTEDEFASAFRRMITLEQYKSEEMNKLYQDVIGIGPVRYSADLFYEMIESGKVNDAAKEFGAWNLALQLFAPLKLMIELSDGGANPDELKENLRKITEQFKTIWMK